MLALGAAAAARVPSTGRHSTLGPTVADAGTASNHETSTGPVVPAKAPKTKTTIPTAEFIPYQGMAKLTCEMQWRKAVKLFPDTSVDDEPDMRGDEFLQGVPPRVLFVHVGKSCGASTQKALERNSDLLKLAGRKAFARVHVHPVRPEVMDAVEDVVIAVRNPIQRVISAYNTAACKEDPEVTDVHVCKRPASYRDRFKRLRRKKESLLECFPNVTAFADGLDDTSVCGRIARRVLHNSETHPLSSNGEHVGMGACFYLGGLLEKLRTKRIHLVHMKSCEEDINAVPRWLGINASFEPGPAVHIGGFPHHMDKPSYKGLKRLERHLDHELAFHDELQRIVSAQSGADSWS
jgi:hypothetical protein